jgi:transposase
MPRFIGVDLHKTMFTVCYLDESGGEELREFKSSQLNLFVKTLRPGDEIAVEATSNSRHFHCAVAGSAGRVVLVAPGQFKVVTSSYKKTDRHDASILALHLSKGMLPEARLMDDDQARVKSLVGTRENLVNLRTRLKNKIHNILNAQGIVSKLNDFSTQKSLETLSEFPLEGLARFEIDLLVEQIKSLTGSIEKIDRALKKPENQLPGHTNLTSITGIGDVGASILLSVIGDIKAFPEAKKLSAYFGLVPRVSQSNATTHYGRITKCGNRLGRKTLVQCSWIAIRYNPILREFYQRIKSKKGSSKAIVATARKLLGLIYLTLDQGLIWSDSNLGVMKS